MKKLMCLLMLLPFASSAQNQLGIKISDISVIVGSSGISAGQLTEQQRSALVSGISLNGLQPRNYGYQTQRFASRYGIALGLQVARSRNFKHKLRLGIHGGTYQVPLDIHLYSQEVYRVDTLVSTQTGQMQYVDSTFSRSQFISHHANMIYLDAAYLAHYMPDRRLSFYTGIGLLLGTSLNNQLTSYYSEFSGRTHYNNYTNYYANVFASQVETKELSSFTHARLYCPVGLNFRLSNRTALLRNMNLFTELAFALDYTNFGGFTNPMSYSMGVNGGVKFSFVDIDTHKGKARPKHRNAKGHKRYH